jgi:hypothetical protein
MDDGSICMWDLREGVFPHREVQREPGGEEWVIRSPTFVISEESHTSRVTAIKALPVSDEGLTNLEDVYTTSTGALPIFQVLFIVSQILILFM